MQNKNKRGNPNKCYYCGNLEKCTKDHFYPKSKGGKLMVYACKVCQGSKKDLDPTDWASNYISTHIAITSESKQRIRVAVDSLIELMNINERK